MPHIIRLRGPWQIEAEGQGGLVCTRRFHQPTGLDSASRVRLIIENAAGLAEISLNGHPLGTAAPASRASFEITVNLQPMNVIAVTIDCPQGLPTSTADIEHILGQVRLEIE
jgi:hypothetical protein